MLARGMVTALVCIVSAWTYVQCLEVGHCGLEEIAECAMPSFGIGHIDNASNNDEGSPPGSDAIFDRASLYGGVHVVQSVCNTGKRDLPAVLRRYRFARQDVVCLNFSDLGGCHVSCINQRGFGVGHNSDPRLFASILIGHISLELLSQYGRLLECAITRPNPSSLVGLGANLGKMDGCESVSVLNEGHGPGVLKGASGIAMRYDDGQNADDSRSKNPKHSEPFTKALLSLIGVSLVAGSLLLIRHAMERDDYLHVVLVLLAAPIFWGGVFIVLHVLGVSGT